MAKNLDRKIDTEAFLRSIRPEIPPAPPKAEMKAVEVQNQEVVKPETADIEMKKQNSLSKEQIQSRDDMYNDYFIQKPTTVARDGNLSYIRKEYHSRIDRLIHLAGIKNLTIAGYIDHVLTKHFEEYEDCIHRFYKKNYKDIF